MQYIFQSKILFYEYNLITSYFKSKVKIVTNHLLLLQNFTYRKLKFELSLLCTILNCKSTNYLL